jgi:hypothetical protein
VSIPFYRNLWFTVALAAAVAAADGYANRKMQVWGDWLAFGLFAYYAAYCVQNFVRCREVHCAITAPGFAVAAALMLIRLFGLAYYEYGLPWIVFVASALTGYCVQWIYKSKTGSVFLRG